MVNTAPSSQAHSKGPEMPREENASPFQVRGACAREVGASALSTLETKGGECATFPQWSWVLAELSRGTLRESWSDSVVWVGASTVGGASKQTGRRALKLAQAKREPRHQDHSDPLFLLARAEGVSSSDSDRLAFFGAGLSRVPVFRGCRGTWTR